MYCQEVNKFGDWSTCQDPCSLSLKLSTPNDKPNIVITCMYEMHDLRLKGMLVSKGLHKSHSLEAIYWISV